MKLVFIMGNTVYYIYDSFGKEIGTGSIPSYLIFTKKPNFYKPLKLYVRK